MRVCKAAGIALCLLVVPVIQGCFGLAATGTAIGGITMQDRRTPGKYIDDEIIELNVLSSILEDDAILNQTHISVTSYNGRVLLTGEAPGESLRRRIVEIARDIPGVQFVHNEIALQAPSTLAARAADSLVTGKVKVALLAENKIRSVHVKVVTERGIVYLMGLLRQDEADRVTEVTRRVAGVQRVVKVIEYIE